MKKIILLLILAFSLTAQEKFLIFFEDKGISEEQFNENPQRFYKTATTHLSEEAIERRKKKLGDNYITFKDFPVNQSYIDELKSSGIKVDNILKWFNAVSIYADHNQIASLKLLPFVDRIEKVKTFKVDTIHDKLEKKSSASKISTYDLDYGNSLPQNELHDIPVVHDAGFNGEGKVIGFLDSGFNWKEHPALKNLEVIYEYDYVFDDPNTANESEDVPGQDGHGTSVFSIAAGFDEGELVGPGYGASFMLAKTEDIGSEKKVEEDNFAAAVEDFEAMGADIITASLGYSLFDEGEDSYTYQDMDGKTTLVARAYNYAFELGVVTVAAAGNEGNSSWRHIISPADAFDVLAVGNVSIEGILRGSSSRGPTADGRIKPEVTAMGTNNYRANSSGTYSGFGSGTSFAAPMVAGMAAQLLSAFPYLTNAQVRDIVLRAGDNFDNPNNDVGYGLLSVQRAVNYPNIWNDGGIYKINKLFVGEDIDLNKTVTINYFDLEGQPHSVDLIESNGYFTFDIPVEFSTGEQIAFYYTYFDSNNSLVTEPENSNYLLTMSELTDSNGFSDNLPSSFELVQNYPNPFNNNTKIRIKSNEGGLGRVVIYNVLGQKVRELYSGLILKGITKLTWDGTDDFGRTVASGPYFYQASLGGQVQTKKMMLLK